MNSFFLREQARQLLTTESKNCKSRMGCLCYFTFLLQLLSREWSHVVAFYVLLADSVTRTKYESLNSYPCPWKTVERCSSLTFYILSTVTDEAFR